MTTDPTKLIRHEYHRAVEHLHTEQKLLDLANDRVTTARAYRDMLRNQLIKDTPTGAGMLAAVDIPWATLQAGMTPHTGTITWTVGVSRSIQAAVAEVAELARISGEEISIPDVNGGTISASPGDVVDDVIKRYVESGGVNLWGKDTNP